jgi:hypothetical protein
MSAAIAVIAIRTIHKWVLTENMSPVGIGGSMEDKRKKPISQWWIAGGIASLLIGYPLSFGPVDRMIRDEILPPACMNFYIPLIYVGNRSPRIVQDVLFWSWRQCYPSNPMNYQPRRFKR